MNKEKYCLSEQIEYSIVIAVFNEEDSVSPLFYSLKEIMDGLRDGYEIIFIDDGSTDSTLKRLNELSISHNSLRVIHFNSNRGQGKAMEEGFRNVKGKIIISMDGDLQNNPEDILKLIFEIKNGFDLVCGWRYIRRDTFVKRIKSRIGNYLQRKITGLNLHDIGCAMRAYKKEIVDGLTFRGRFDHSILPCIVSKTKNIKITEVKISDTRRKFGKTKYGHLSTISGTVFDFIRLFYSSRKADNNG